MRSAGNVSIHAPAWGATGERTFELRAQTVSIHAPAWGATKNGCKVACGNEVSIHAPAWGATSSMETVAPLAVLFQSTHPRGVRRGTVGDTSSSYEVSIHAPAWGATRTYGRRRSTTSCFNPRTRVGCDARGRCAGWPRACFNPRTRVGCDIGAQLVLTQAGGVSIHAPAWGATSAHSLYSHRPEAFQSTHPRGVRHGKSLTVSGTTLCFNPRTRVGCDGFGVAVIGAPVAVSIHAPAWGATERDNERDA